MRNEIKVAPSGQKAAQGPQGRSTRAPMGQGNRAGTGNSTRSSNASAASPEGTPAGSKPRAAKAPRPRREGPGLWQRVTTKLFAPATARAIGLGLIFLGLALLAAMVSYAFTWQTDQDLVHGAAGELIANPDVLVHNALGRMGASAAHLLVHQGFGIPTLALAAFMVALGLKFVYPALRMRLGTWALRLLWFVPLTSFTLGYIVKEALHTANYQFAAGAFGLYVNHWSVGLLGTLGTGVLLFFAWVAKPLASLRLGERAAARRAASANEEAEMPEYGEDNLIVPDAYPTTARGIRIERSVTPQAGALPWDEPTLSNGRLPQQPARMEEDEYDGDEAEELDEAKLDGNEYDELVDAGQTLVSTPPIEAPATPHGLDFMVHIPEDELVEDPSLSVADLPALASVDATIAASGFGTDLVRPEVHLDGSPVDEPHSLEAIAAMTPEQLVALQGPYDPTADLSGFQFPLSDLLVEHGSSKLHIDPEELQRNKNQIVETLRNFGIEIDRITATVGPTVTLYEIVPAAGIRISKIKNLEDDIALALAALGIRIIAPMPGKGTIGIEVPNLNPVTVSMRSILQSEKFRNSTADLPIALGKTISNEIFIADLARMPHLLMAGATGQGKSVGLNCLLVSLLYKKHPAELKFVLVDPKKVELSLYSHIEKHYLAKLPGEEEAIITDTSKVVSTLNSLVIEMDNRYSMLKEAQVRTISEYNAKFKARRLSPAQGHEFLPYIVLVVDEFADLMMTAGKQVELPIARLAQLARAVGIHLVIATQRPSVNIITGTIKANFPARIAFKVSSKIDSRTILDTGGADQLIGRGDMLLSNGSEIIRLQCAFVDTPEVEAICNYIGSQKGYAGAKILPEFVGEGKDGEAANYDPTERDSLFEEAAHVIVETQQGSTSLLQRRLKLGYNRAGRLMDELEAARIVGPNKGSKVREVLVAPGGLEQFLNDLTQSNPF